MARSNATTVEAYLASLPPDRRAALQAVRKVILENLPEGFEEEMAFGMIGYVVPLSAYPKTYNGQPLMLAALGSQKHHMAVYLMSIHGDAELRRWFEAAYRASGKRMDVGKSCVRFRSLEDLPIELIGEAIAKVDRKRYIAIYEASRA